MSRPKSPRVKVHIAPHTYSRSLEIPLKRTRSTGSSPGRSSRSTPTFNSRRLEHNTRPTLTKSNSTNSNKHSLTSDFLARRDTSPILEALSDQESVTPMAPGPKLPPEGDTAKDKDLKRLPTPSLPPPVASADTLDGHISDSSSLSELDDSEAETERLEDSPRKPKPVFVANPVSKSSRLPPTKLHLEIKQNKSTDISMGGVHEDDPQTQGSISKKRKREHTVDVRQKEPTEEKASRPATPLMKKDLAVTDKSKKSKGEEVHQSKAGNASNNVSPSKPVTNGRGLSGDPEHSFKADDQEKISPESQSQVEKTTDTSIDKHSKEGGSPGDDEVEADDETVVEASREDEEGNAPTLITAYWITITKTSSLDAERLQKRKAASEALMQIELEFARLREK